MKRSISLLIWSSLLWTHIGYANEPMLNAEFFSKTGYYVLELELSKVTNSTRKLGTPAKECYHFRSAAPRTAAYRHGGYLCVVDYGSPTLAQKAADELKNDSSHPKGGSVYPGVLVFDSKLASVSATGAGNMGPAVDFFLSRVKDFIQKKKLYQSKHPASVVTPELTFQRDAAIKGPLTQNEFQATRTKNFGKIKECYRKFAGGYPVMVDENWKITMYVARAGKVSKLLPLPAAEKNEVYVHDKIERCVFTQLSTWVFPRKNAVSTVEFELAQHDYW